jgi:hypothetical protein
VVHIVPCNVEKTHCIRPVEYKSPGNGALGIDACSDVDPDCGDVEPWNGKLTLEGEQTILELDEQSIHNGI